MVSNRRCVLLTFISTSALLLFVWWITSKPTFDRTQKSLVIPDANFPILKPIVTPRNTKEQLFLLVLVSSAPAGVSIERRQAIRKTWGKATENGNARRWRVVFMTGRTGDEKKDESLFRESREYGDLLIYDYKDQYSKIVTKLLGSYQWAVEVKEKYAFQYLLKTDDDVYVAVPRVLQWIDNKGAKLEYVYAGTLYNNYVVRDKTHRHYVSEDDLPYDVFPVFCKGSMLLLSGSLIPKIVELAKRVRRIIPDDAYTGLLMNELRVQPIRIEGLVQHSFLSYFLRFFGPCQFQNAIGMGDSLSTEQMLYIHSQISSRFQPVSVWLCVGRWVKLVFIMVVVVCSLYFIRKKLRFLKIQSMFEHLIGKKKRNKKYMHYR